MANELQFQLTTSYNKGGVTLSESATKKITISGSAVSKKTQALTTTKEAIDVGDCGTSAYVIIKNLGDTNDAVVMATDGADTVVAKIQPGHFAMFQNNGVANTIKSSASTTTVETIAIAP